MPPDNRNGGTITAVTNATPFVLSLTAIATTTFGEDSAYTTAPAANPQSFTDNGDGTITDNVTGLMWQKTDAGEMTWENAVNNASTQST